jgi:hypothetical protein
VVHGGHVALLQHAVLLREISLSKSLHANVSSDQTGLQKMHIGTRRGTTYGLVGLITDLLAHELIHPFVGLIVIATVGRKAGNDERHDCDEFA